uniref:IGF-like family receptor 1 isoform X2 n=1 Tax=Scatophagus argus TaxID=75038 RepID=UPI001ED8459C|nr:IGF-like family receptor 1 isoform X2 [Scatophagus argus]
MTYSEKCLNLTTYWDRANSKCVLCELLAGYEVSPNCGYDDRGGRHEGPHRQCKPGTFNDGSTAYCQPCTSCPPGVDPVSLCNLTTDTKCPSSRQWTTEAPVTVQTITENVPKTITENVPKTTTENVPDPSTDVMLWQSTVLTYNRRSSYINAGFSPLSSSPNNHLEGSLSPTIQSAPLQIVLDNLDVLEELVILLDPESHGVKNTKHLASHCSFPSTWITYTYSMKDSKSPLKAVLEGLTSRNPEWTVGHLADLLRLMERNDAVAVLAKLRVKEMAV